MQVIIEKNFYESGKIIRKMVKEFTILVGGKLSIFGKMHYLKANTFIIIKMGKFFMQNK
jgi:hypothetical protein